MHSTYY